MKLTVYTKDGADAGRSVDLDDAVFGVAPNDHAIWLDVRAIQAHKRQGTHKTKERGEVSKSRRKLYRQKGTGNARAGDAKSPLRKGGGTIFGPKPHEYKLNVNRKTKQLARRSALAYKLDADALRVIENVEMSAPKTREIAGLLKSNGVSGKALVLTSALDDVLYRSARNIPGVSVLPASQASTLDLLNAKTVLLQEGAVEALTTALRPATKATVDTNTPVTEPEAAKADAVEVPAVEAPMDPVANSTDGAADADDLTALWGVGPVFSDALVAGGISTFAALAETDLEALRAIIAETSGSEASANEETWAEQARFLAADDADGFDAYVASLKADSDS